MKISHTPELPSERIGKYRPSQWLKSPTTETRLALGAQTANDTPMHAIHRSRMCAPSFW